MKADLQRFKENDTTEAKMIAAAMPALDEDGLDLDAFFDGAFSAYQLGDILYDLNRDAMVDAVTRDTYRRSFPAIHQLFTKPGTFEYYLEVFRAIWGNTVEVEFTIPFDGWLQINVRALDLEQFRLIAREVVDNNYVYSPLTDGDGDYLLVTDTEGIKSQQEIDALMNELTPYGVYVETTLSL